MFLSSSLEDLEQQGENPTQRSPTLHHLMLGFSNLVKGKAHQTGIPRELVEFEHEDVYVDMDECADQQSTKDSCGKECEVNVDSINETEQDAHEYPVVNYKEKNDEEHSEYNVSDEISDMIDDYCFSIPADNPLGPFTNDDLPYALQVSGAAYKEDSDEEWFCAASGNYSSEDKNCWQKKKYENNSESLHENQYVPLPVYSSTGDLPVQESHKCVTASTPPGENLPVQSGCSQEEDINNEKMSCDALGEHPEKGNGSENYGEPVVITSTEDDVYIIFETSTKDTQRGQKSFILHNPAAPGAISNPTIESGTPHITQEERKDNNNEYVSNDELDKYLEEGNNNEYDEEEQLLVASSKDDVYIVFETNIKDKQRGQKSFIANNPVAPEATSNSTTESGASYTAQAESRDESIDERFYWADPVDESNEENPYSFAYADDDLYMELPGETTDEENIRGRKSFIVHRAPAPAPRPQVAATDIEDSYITRVFRQKEKEKNIYGAGAYQDKVQMAKPEANAPPQHHVLSGQDELILLQEKVKLGIISMDEALHKFHQWQNEKSGLDLLQQKKLQQLRDNIIGDKPDDDKVYDKITIVHQPNAFPAKQRGVYEKFDSSIYQKPHKPAHTSTPYYPMKKDNGTSGKLPYAK